MNIEHMADTLATMYLFFLEICMKRHIRTISFILAVVFCLAGHSVNAKAATTQQLFLPRAEGTKELVEDTIKIDISNIDQGYLIAEYKGKADNIYVQLTGPDQVAYKYFVTREEKRCV